MKLNLLPNYVSKASQARTAFIASLAVLLLSIVGAVLMIGSSGSKRKAAVDRVEELKTEHDQVVQLAKSAESVAAVGTEFKRNIDLSVAMANQNQKYTGFYRSIRNYIPPYYRVTSMSVRPIDENTCRLLLIGSIKTYQQYADCALALLRIPGAQNVARDGFAPNYDVRPGLDLTDQVGLPHKLNEGRKPPLGGYGPNGGPDAQMQYLMAQAQQYDTTGFSGVGGFGIPSSASRGSMPGWSTVVYEVKIARDPSIPAEKQLETNFMTPLPADTLKAKPGASAAASGGSGGGPAGGAAPAGVATGAPAAPPGRGRPRGPSDE